MKNLKLFIPLFVGMIILSCCKETSLDEVTVAKVAVSSNSVKQMKLVPFKGSFETFSERLNTSSPNQRITGNGQASHVGKAKFESLSTLIFTTPPPFTLSGTSIMEAANGDKIYTNFTGTATPQPDGTTRLSISHTFTGGTGRFQDVSGYFHHFATANPASPLGFIEVKGEISY